MQVRAEGRHARRSFEKHGSPLVEFAEHLIVLSPARRDEGMHGDAEDHPTPCKAVWTRERHHVLGRSGACER